LGDHLDSGTIDDHLNAAIPVGAQDAQAWNRLQVAERDGVRMPVLVALAGGDERHARPQQPEQGRPRRGLGPVVADLEHVHRPQHAALEQSPLDGRLGVAGQQRPEPPVLEQRHHRRVVDVVLGQRAGCVGIGWEQDGQGRAGIQG
jgi:hypothetical protein